MSSNMSGSVREIQTIVAPPSVAAQPDFDLSLMRRDRLIPSPPAATVTNTVSQVFEYGHSMDANTTSIQIRSRIETNFTSSNNNRNVVYSEAEIAYVNTVIAQAQEYLLHKDKANAVQEVIELSDTEYDTEIERMNANRPKRLSRNKARLGNDDGTSENTNTLPEPPVHKLSELSIEVPQQLPPVGTQDQVISTNSSLLYAGLPPPNSNISNPYANLFEDCVASSITQPIQNMFDFPPQPVPAPTTQQLNLYPITVGHLNSQNNSIFLEVPNSQSKKSNEISVNSSIPNPMRSESCSSARIVASSAVVPQSALENVKYQSSTIFMPSSVVNNVKHQSSTPIDSATRSRSKSMDSTMKSHSLNKPSSSRSMENISKLHHQPPAKPTGKLVNPHKKPTETNLTKQKSVTKSIPSNKEVDKTAVEKLCTSEHSIEPVAAPKFPKTSHKTPSSHSSSIASRQERSSKFIVPKITVHPPIPDSQPIAPHDLFDIYPNQDTGPIEQVPHKKLQLSQIVKRSQPVKLPTSVRRVSIEGETKTSENVENPKTSEKAEKAYSQALRDPRVRNIFDYSSCKSNTKTSNCTSKPVWGVSFKNQQASESSSSKMNDIAVKKVCSARRLLDSSSSDEMPSANVGGSDDVFVAGGPEEVNIEVGNSIATSQDVSRRLNSSSEKTPEIVSEEKGKYSAGKISEEKLKISEENQKKQGRQISILEEIQVDTEETTSKTVKRQQYVDKLSEMLKRSAEKNQNTGRIRINYDTHTDNKQEEIFKTKMAPSCIKTKANTPESKTVKPKIGSECINKTQAQKINISKPKIGSACFENEKVIGNTTVPNSKEHPRFEIPNKAKAKVGPLCSKFKNKKPKIGPASYKFKDLIGTHDICNTKSETYILPKCNVPLLRLDEKDINHFKKHGKYSNSLASILKNYYQRNEDDSKIMCLLCSGTYKKIVEHYKRQHPNAEVFISRMSPSALTQAIAEAEIPAPANPTLCCRFCYYTTENSLAFYCHCSSHTGEFNFKCGACDYVTPNKPSVLSHINSKHRNKSVKVTQLANISNSMSKFPAYVCRYCKYLQMNQEQLLSHLHKVHKSTDFLDCIKINLASYIPDKQALQDQSPHCGLRKKFCDAAGTSKMTGSQGLKPKQTATQRIPSKATASSTTKESSTLNEPGLKRKRCYQSEPPRRHTSKRRRQDFQCNFCAEWYFSSKGEWLQCLACMKWIHDECTEFKDHCNRCAESEPWCHVAKTKSKPKVRSKVVAVSPETESDDQLWK